MPALHLWHHFCWHFQKAPGPSPTGCSHSRSSWASWVPHKASQSAWPILFSRCFCHPSPCLKGFPSSKRSPFSQRFPFSQEIALLTRPSLITRVPLVSRHPLVTRDLTTQRPWSQNQRLPETLKFSFKLPPKRHPAKSIFKSIFLA